MARTRSATGCLACKTKHKKCDETKPHCLRCLKSRIACPGYTYVQNLHKPSKKLRTVPAPRTVAGRSRTTTHQEAPLVNVEGSEAQPQDQSPIGYELVTSDPSYSAMGSSAVPNAGTLSEAINISNNLTSSPSSSESLQHSSVDFNPSHRPIVNITNPGPDPPFSSTSTAAPTTSGQASLMEALLSLGQPPDPDPPQQCAQPRTRPTTALLLDTSIPVISNRSPDTERQGNSTTHDTYLDVAVSMTRRQPVLDRTAESNALPFVLQSYATWIGRMALEPLHLTHLARDFVLSHFEGGEQSRWIVVLLANIGSRIGSVDPVGATPRHLVSMLQKAVWRRIAAVKSLPSHTEPELVKALDCAIETMLIHVFASPLSEVMTLRQEAAPIFRQLCPEPPGAPIDLHSLLQHPLRCLRHYAEIDLTFSVVSGMPTLFQYQVTIPNSQHSNPDPASQGEDIIQWLHGIPNRLLLSFAKMKSMHQDGLIPDGEMVTSIEQDLQELPSFSGYSSDRFLAIMRCVVQECWRQAAFVYLYMAVCGDPCDTPRVRQAFKRYVKLLQGTKPGRLPDEFLILTLLLISPAAEQKSGRETIRKRILGLYTHSKTLRDNCIGIFVIEDYWARADAEGRPTMWSDVAVSRKRIVGI
ncbi:hypothetical protein B0J17DRAFT_640224 [Rhizoctonia solani]|nr:hypothetical protein B0J17DRAFT_640224 [Rhizoctonia solani]